MCFIGHNSPGFATSFIRRLPKTQTQEKTSSEDTRFDSDSEEPTPKNGQLRRYREHPPFFVRSKPTKQLIFALTNNNNNNHNGNPI